MVLDDITGILNNPKCTLIIRVTEEDTIRYVVERSSKCILQFTCIGQSFRASIKLVVCLQTFLSRQILSQERIGDTKQIAITLTFWDHNAFGYFPTMDSQQLVDTASQNSQDIVLPKPASSTPRHSIDAILGLANNKRSHQEMEDNGRDAQENAGNKNVYLLFSFLDSIGISNKRRLHNRYTFLNFNF